jgi:hypothetical protein
MTARLPLIVWGATAVLVVGLLTRNLLAIPVLAPLDPNEGWNAAHALSLLAGQGLYPPPHSLMVNNYPPLSFYLVAALTKATGDAVIAGRILAMAAFLASCAGLALILRPMGATARAQCAAILFFAATLLTASDYVGMADPQLLAHAVQLAALLLALRGKTVLAALIFAVSLLVKHNLLALPLATFAWLYGRDRHAGLRFAAMGIAVIAAAMMVFRLVYGTSLLTVLSSSRLMAWSNIGLAVTHLWWAVLPLGLLFFLRNPCRSFCVTYAGIALALGLIFSAGDGVDANAFFDLAIACALAMGLASDSVPLRAALCALALPVFLVWNFHGNNFFFTGDFRGQSARDIAFLKSHPGPALCEQLSLCLWAGKKAEVDVFNIGEQIKTGARDPATLMRMIATRHFAVLQLEDLDALGPVRAEIEQNYRADYSDDNGIFFTPLY